MLISRRTDVGSKANHLAQAKKLRDRAAECRTLAKIAADESVASSYLMLADDYERLAQDEADLANAYRQ